jgi:GNAT superfamily N-acetyltransferase
MTVARVDAAWAAFFGLSPSVFTRPGVQVVAHRQLAGYEGAWLFRHRDSLCVSVPAELLEATRAAARDRTLESLFDDDGIRALWGGRVQRIVGPAYQGHVDSSLFRPAPHPGTRALAPSDRMALRRLADACEGDEWEHGAIDPDEPHVFGCFANDQLVAAARYRPLWEETAHIGVVTHPAHRGQGRGRAVVSAATAAALEAGLVVLYQTLLANAPSVALVSRLGYRQYASHLAVRLATPGAA